MNAVDPATWRQFVNHVVSVWSGYQLGVDSNSGGDDTKQKHEWFVDVLAEHIYMNSSVKVEELEDWVTHILYNDFDLILDDDSVYPTSLLLLEGFGYLKKKDTVRFDQLVAGLPSQKVIQEVKKTSRLEVDDDDEEMTMDDLEEEMDDMDDPDEPRRERQPRTVTDDDGWTTILKR